MNILDILPFLIVFSGCYLAVKLRFFMFLHPIRCFRSAKAALKTKSARRSFFLSLAGTLGVGNIVGVAFGISVGGAGCVFWLLASSLFASVIKYAEASCAKDKSSQGRGGVMYVIKDSFRGRFKVFAPIYAIFCLLLSFTMGAGLQARAAVESICEGGAFYIIISAILALACFFAVNEGGEKIERFTAIIIPIAAIIYIMLCLAILFVNRGRLASVISDIFISAISYEAALGGIGAYLLSDKIREGFCRGLLSNEAGAGTSAMAHARNEDCDPGTTGILGIFEVFADTAILCTLTALTVLTSLPDLSEYSSGMEIIRAAVMTLSPKLLPLLSFSIISFAYSTIICWYYYGRVSLDFLFPKGKRFYTAVYLIFIVFTAFIPSEFLIISSDYFLFFMSVISIFTLIKNSDRLVYLSEKSGFINTKKLRKNSNSRKNGNT